MIMIWLDKQKIRDISYSGTTRKKGSSCQKKSRDFELMGRRLRTFKMNVPSLISG